MRETENINNTIIFLRKNNFAIEIIEPENPAFANYLNPERGPKSNPSVVFKPENEQSLQQLILALNKYKASAVLFAGNTGLVSAQKADGEAVIDLNYLNNLISITLNNRQKLDFSLLDKSIAHFKKAEIWLGELQNFIQKNNLQKHDFKDAIIECQSAVPVGSINYVLEVAGVELPIDTGAVTVGGGMTVGAGVANASHGTYGILYGKLSDLAIQVRAINGNGNMRVDENRLQGKINIDDSKTIINSARAQYGESAIGTQGTFAVITNLKLKTTLIPDQQHYYMVRLQDIGQAKLLRNKIREQFPLNLRQFELMDAFSLELVKKYEGDNFIWPFEDESISNYTALIEAISDNIEEGVSIVLYDFIKALGIADKDLAYAGINNNDVTGSPDAFVKMRHSITGASNKHMLAISGGDLSSAYQHRVTPDISVPMNNVEAFIEELKTKLSGYQLCLFGHFSIAAFHLHIFSESKMDRLKVTESIFEAVAKYQGSCWSEHGIGIANAELYEKYTPKEYVAEWFSYKKVNDPNNILSPRSNNFNKNYKKI